VYLPLLVQQATEEARRAGSSLTAEPGADAAALAVASALSAGGGGSSRELLASLQKYLGHVTQALAHQGGDAALKVPELRIASIVAGAADPDTVEALEEAAAGWSEAIAALVTAEGQKQPGSKGLLAEVEFWRARSAVLSGASEQLALPHVQTMLAVLDAGSEDRQLLAVLRGQAAELDKHAAEVRAGDGHGGLGSMP
jgi:dynein heavy chain